LLLCGLIGGAGVGKKALFLPLLLSWTLSAIFLGLSGAKNYYYATPTTPLLLMGALQLEEWANSTLKKGFTWVVSGSLASFSILLLPILFFPLSPKLEEAYMDWARNSTVMQGAFRWEDGEIHPLPQDFADKRGWVELTPIVDSVYKKLAPSQQVSCLVFGDNYGLAGAMNWCRKPNTPWTAMCLNGSFAYWASLPPTLTTMIYVNEGEYQTLYAFFDSIAVVGKVRDHQARIFGDEVLLCTHPKKEAYAKIQQEFLEAKANFR
jgi:hypothetical protein